MSMNKGFAQHAHQSFSDWYRATTPGQALNRLEFRYLSSELKLTYNQMTLQVGHPGDSPPISGYSAYASCLIAGRAAHQQLVTAPIISLAEDLPFGTQTLDIVCIMHVLEFSPDPRRILSECERILKPQGELHVIALNPWNPANLPRCIPVLIKGTDLNLVTPSRLTGWLQALRLDSELIVGFSLTPECYLPNSGSLLARSRAYVATAYAVRAIKRRQRPASSPTWAAIPQLIGGSRSVEASP